MVGFDEALFTHALALRIGFGGGGGVHYTIVITQCKGIQLLITQTSSFKPYAAEPLFEPGCSEKQL